MAVTAPVRTETIYRAAQERIKQYIITHNLGPGDPIPTEMVLARELGISRNSLREALKALATAGVVESRNGLGTYVGQASLAPLIDGMAFNLLRNISRDTRTLREMLQVRESLEVELVRRAAGVHSPEQLDRLEACVIRMEADAERGLRNPSIDLAFHDALYEPLDNRVVTLILHAFWDIKEAVIAHLPASPADSSLNAHWHRTILDAVRCGDADAAAAAMRQQFTGVRSLLNLTGDERQPPLR